MKKIFTLMAAMGFFLTAHSQFTCSDAEYIYNGYNSVPINTSGSSAPSGSYGCLGSNPINPTWLFIKACQQGGFDFEVKGYQGATQVDMDFVVFGNYSPSTFPCSDLTSGNVSYCDNAGNPAMDTGQVSSMLQDYTAVLMISNSHGANLDSLSVYLTSWNGGLADPSCASCVTNNPVQEICFITADSTNVYNEIIWEKAISNDVSHYEILRENAIGGWDVIGTVDYDSLSTFVDTTAPGIQQPFRYNIRAIDTCFQSVDGTSPHTTMHLATSNGSNGVIHLLWTQYLGLSGYQTYYIWRGSSPTNLTLLDSVFYTTTSYTDWQPLSGQSYYQIEVRPGFTCQPTRSGIQETVFSNISPNVVMGTDDLSAWRSEIKVYPVPASDQLTIEGPLRFGDRIELMDQTGRVVMKANYDGTPLHLSTIDRGHYFLRITDNKGRTHTKVVPVMN